MKKLKFFMLLFATIISSAFSACTDDEAISDIVGTWYGEWSYYNPVGGTKYEYLTIDFSSDKTGELYFETPVYISEGSFTWEVSGNTITCKGVKVSMGYEDDEPSIDENFTLTLLHEGNSLIPQNSYTQFVLTKTAQ